MELEKESTSTPSPSEGYSDLSAPVFEDNNFVAFFSELSLLFLNKRRQPDIAKVSVEQVLNKRNNE